MIFSRKRWAFWVSSAFVVTNLAGGCTVQDKEKEGDKPSTTPGDGGDGGTGGSSGTSGKGASGGGDSLPGDGGTGNGQAGAPDAPGGGGSPEPGGGGEGGTATEPGPGGGGEGGGEGLPPGEPVSGTARDKTGPLVFQITAARSPVVPGEHVTYYVTVGNTSNVDVTDVKVVLNVPAGLSFGSGADSVPSSSSCGNGTCSAGEEATWTLGTLGPQSSQTIVLSPEVTGAIGDGDTLITSFRLNATGVSSLLLDKSLPVQSAPDAELSLEADADPVVPGQTVKLVLNAGQVSTDWIDAASLRLQLPSGLVLGEISDGGSADDTGAVVWPLGDVDVGTSFRRTVTAQVHGGAIPGDTLAARASLTFDGGLAIDNVAELQVTVIPEPQSLSLSVTSLFGPAKAGGVVGYQINALNTGRRALNGVQLLVPVPPGLSFDSGQDAVPNSSTCGNGTCSGHELASWSLGTIEAGITRTITLTPTVVASLAGDGSILSLPFILRAQGMQTVYALKSDPVFTLADGQVILGTPVSPVTPGQTFTYELAVGQSGTAALRQTALTVALPAGVSIGAVSNGGSKTGQLVSWDLADVALGATLRRSVEVTVKDDVRAGSTLLARAHLGYEGDLELDATSEYAVAVVAEPLPLKALLAVPDAAVTPGAVAACTTTIENVSTQSVDTVTAVMRVAGMSFNSSQDSEPNSSTCGNGTCGTGEEASWALGSIPAAGTATISLFPTLTSSLKGGTLVTVRQLLNATELGSTIQLQKTILTKP